MNGLTLVPPPPPTMGAFQPSTPDRVSAEFDSATLLQEDKIDDERKETSYSPTVIAQENIS